MIAFTMPMVPRGQGRARASARGGFARMHKDPKDVANERTIAALAAPYRPATQLAGAVEVSIVATFPRPASRSKTSKRTGEPLQDPRGYWHTSRPDADNIAKGVLDALDGWWGDDAQVCSLTVAKRVAAFGEMPHYRICIKELDQ